MNSKQLPCIILTILLGLNAPSILAKEHNNKHKKKHDKALPHGLQKKQSRGKPLPPGWQKKLHKGDILSNDIYSYSIPLMRDDYRHYHVGKGEIAIRLDGKVIRLLKATHTILEILDE